ncbi:MAG TPA: hypothetical protein VMU60_13215 [Syntrophobacteria bacterium]|nr:hypothetical protein [Syntrophobacteria bacterium]
MAKYYHANPTRVASDQHRFFPWIQPYYFPTHRYEFAAFLLCSFLILALFLLGIILTRNVERQRHLSPKAFPWIFVADIFLVYTLLHVEAERASLISTILLVGAWGILVGLPYYRIILTTPQRANRLGTFFAAAVGAAATVEFVALIGPLALSKPFILNEYLDVPSQTFVPSNNDTPPRAVDNLRYINSERLWGNHFRYDPRLHRGEDPPCLEGNCIDLPRTERLEDFVEVHKQNWYFHYPSGLLCFVGPMSKDDYGDLRSLYAEDFWPRIEGAYLRNQRIYHDLFERGTRRNPEHVDFLRKNLFELVQAIHDLELTFHHHFQFLNPIKELALGRPSGEIVALYGTNFIILKGLLDLAGGVTYEAFLHLMFASYLLYYALFAAVLFYILRDVRLVALVLLVAFGSIKGLGYITLFTGLGYTPVRHFLDIIVILFAYRYFTQNRPIWIGLAFGFALANVFLDRFLGAFVLAALAGILVVRLVFGHASHRRIEFGLLVATLVVLPVLFVSLGKLVAGNPYMSGFLDGVWGFPATATLVAFILLGLTAAYGLLAYALKTRFSHTLYFVLFLVFYVHAYWFYWLLVPNYGHLYVIYPYLALAVAAAIKFVLLPPVPERHTNLAHIAILAAVGLAALYSAFTSTTIWNTRGQYYKVAKDHAVHEWVYPNMSVSSSMEPDLFANAAALIGKHANSVGIYILSQHDALLTFLAGKYSLMPHFELGTYLNSWKTFDRVLALLGKDRPEVIFVDTDIRVHHHNALFMLPIPGLHQDYSRRLHDKLNRLEQLQKLFAEIQEQYEKVDQTELLSVYRRKRPAAAS